MALAFVLVTADGVRRGLVGEVIQRLENKNLKLKSLKLEQYSEDQLREHSSTCWPDLVSSLASGPVVPMVWEGEDVLATAHEILDDIESHKPANSDAQKVVYVAETEDQAEKEAAFWFYSGACHRPVAYSFDREPTSAMEETQIDSSVAETAKSAPLQTTDAGDQRPEAGQEDIEATLVEPQAASQCCAHSGAEENDQTCAQVLEGEPLASDHHCACEGTGLPEVDSSEEAVTVSEMGVGDKAETQGLVAVDEGSAQTEAKTEETHSELE